jgi:hypothetical protein
MLADQGEAQSLRQEVRSPVLGGSRKNGELRAVGDENVDPENSEEDEADDLLLGQQPGGAEDD